MNMKLRFFYHALSILSKAPKLSTYLEDFPSCMVQSLGASLISGFTTLGAEFTPWIGWKLALMEIETRISMTVNGSWRTES